MLTSDDLVFVVGGVDELCGGNVGTQGEKWCVVSEEQCAANGPRSHRRVKTFDIRLGLYVRVPGVEKHKIHAFCEPFVPKEKLTIDLVGKFMTFTKSPAKWGEEFALLNDGQKKKEEEHLEKKEMVSKFKACATPGPSQRAQNANPEVKKMVGWIQGYHSRRNKLRADGGCKFCSSAC